MRPLVSRAAHGLAVGVLQPHGILNWMEIVVLIVHVLAVLSIIGLVLLQQGRGADIGASFGAGASQTFFGSQGSGSFMSNVTTGIAVLFFVTSFGLAYFAKQQAAALGGQSQTLVAPAPEAQAPPPGDAKTGEDYSPPELPE